MKYLFWNKLTTTIALSFPGITSWPETVNAENLPCWF